jgi:hypothetical protein
MKIIKGCVGLTKDPTQHSRAKHIDIRYHFVGETIMEKEVLAGTIYPTERMIADIFTKALPAENIAVSFRRWDFINSLSVRMDDACLVSRSSSKNREMLNRKFLC